MISTDSKSLEKLRPCGRLETFSTARHHLGFFKNVGFTATYTNSSTTTPDVPLETLIYNALRTVVQKHSILSAITLDEDKSFPEPYFARIPEVDLRKCVHFIERKDQDVEEGGRDEELDEVLTQYHNVDFKDEIGAKPFWRLVVLHVPGRKESFTASWIFHHALSDGASAFLFHETFLGALRTSSSAASAALDSNPVVKSPDTSLLPSLEELHPLPLSWSFFLKEILGSIFPSWFNPRPAKLWTGNLIADPKPVTLRSVVLDANTTKKVAQLSRKNGTSVTATLECIIADAVLSNIDSSAYHKIISTGPISMKRFLLSNPANADKKSQIEDGLVLAMTQYEYLHSRLSTSAANEDRFLTNFSWDEARNVKKEITKEVSKKGKDSDIGLLRYVSNMQQFFTEKIGKERSSTFEVSNVGVYQPKIDNQEGWKVGRMCFSQGPNVTAATFSASVVTGGDGCLVIGFSWLEGALDDNLMVRIQSFVERGIKVLTERDV